MHNLIMYLDLHHQYHITKIQNKFYSEVKIFSILLLLNVLSYNLSSDTRESISVYVFNKRVFSIA